MNGKLNHVLVVAAALVISLLAYRYGSAQLEGMEAPNDVTGTDCRMCHTDFALNFQHPHAPALNGECASCHQTVGEKGHGELVASGRALCTGCHTDKEEHYPVATCWSAGCHSDVHGSNVDEKLIASRAEEYPGFFAATDGAQYVGSADCLGCHPEQCATWSQSAHSMSDEDSNVAPERKGCESCHGPGGNHNGRLAGIGRFDEAYSDESDSVCLKCHRDEMYMPDYEASTHVKAHVSCVSCHDPHLQKNKANLLLPSNELCLSCHETKRADFKRLSHHPIDTGDERTGMLCVDCHSPHGSANSAMLTKPAEEICASCHVDKAGPFVFPHAGYDPALGRGCATCHTHHGSNSPNLLTINGRGLCLQCHTDRAQHYGAQTCWTAGCHSQHHGSNTSFYFMD
jgi:DmsE family decaheme c-type cytochrome